MPATKRSSTVKRVPGTRKSLIKSQMAKKNPALRKYAMANKKAYADYKAGKIAGLAFSKERKFGQLLGNSTYKAHVKSLVK